MNLRALLLSAGLGTRLRPLTLKTPKCLVKIAGKPLLEIWLEQLEELQCEEVIINTHYLANQVEEFLLRRQGSLRIKIKYEPELLGTAGTLIANRNFFQDSTGLLLHSDNLTTTALKEFLKAHRNKPKDCLLTMMTFKTSNPSNCGIVKTDERAVLQEFYEKVPNPPGNIANSAIYLFDTPFIQWLERQNHNISDFSTEIIPKLIGKIYTWQTNDFFMDIGTPQALAEAQNAMSSNLGDKR